MTTPALLLRLSAHARRLTTLVEQWLAPCFDLGIRLYLANVFLPAGLLKLRDWSSTLALFQYEYHVPLLPTALAAVLGTAGEIVLPVMLVLGLAGRFSAAGLTVINIVAVISYPEISELGIQDHVLWGILLLVTLLHGPGRFSCDAWLMRRWFGP